MAIKIEVWEIDQIGGRPGNRETRIAIYVDDRLRLVIVECTQSGYREENEWSRYQLEPEDEALFEQVAGILGLNGGYSIHWEEVIVGEADVAAYQTIVRKDERGFLADTRNIG